MDEVYRVTPEEAVKGQQFFWGLFFIFQGFFDNDVTKGVVRVVI